MLLSILFRKLKIRAIAIIAACQSADAGTSKSLQTDATRTERDTFGPLEVPADKCGF